MASAARDRFTRARSSTLLASADFLNVTLRASLSTGTSPGAAIVLESSNTGVEGEWEEVMTLINKQWSLNTVPTEQGAYDPTVVGGVLAGLARLRIDGLGTNPNFYLELWATGRSR